MRTIAVILAAGSGTRFGADKTQMVLHGKPLWRHSFDTYLNHPDVDGVGLIGSSENVDQLRAGAPEAIFVELGGATRTHSSRKAVELAPCDRILIHDAARPFVSSEVISRVLAALTGSPAAAAAVKVTDTIRFVTPDGTTTPDRNALFAMQTPQGAHHSVLAQAYSENTGEFTDEMALLESVGIQPKLVDGDPRNFKVTTPEDFLRAQSSFGFPETRTGLGYDIHPVATDGRPMMLGGVHFEGPGLEGHSDADVVLHAATDALLGAAALGDIGEHFPNTDPRWRGAPSSQFLAHAVELLRSNGWEVVHLDISVVAEFPKIMPKANQIRGVISEILGVEVSRVSIKATTNERLGAIGRNEGIAAFAIATIRGRPVAHS